MICEVTMYQAVCDGCGKNYGEDKDICAWGDESIAIDQAVASGWELIEEGDLLYCEACYADLPEEAEAAQP